MIKQISIVESRGFDPYQNLALEKYLLDHVAPEQCILYLWQNQNTVVIGRNQNAWAECRTALLEEEGGKLARRLSGGGAVFHDLGNLNFTFLVSKDNYDVDRQLSVIQEACALVGLTAMKSGRNDLLTEGCKFSGNAFYQGRENAYHHGTLLIDVDMEKLSRYLSPPKAKLEAKGIRSVRSRVVNLKSLAPELTIEKMKAQMVAGFETVYGLKSEILAIPSDDYAEITETARKISSWEYLYGTPLPFTFDCQAHYPWGHIQLQLDAKGGIITDAKVYTDAMDWQLPATIEESLTGCKFALPQMRKALQNTISDRQIAADLCQMLEAQEL